MQIAQLQSSASLAEIATRVYQLKSDDTRVADAAKALAAANPHLTGRLSSLPAGTPVVVPDLPNVTTNVADTVNPSRTALANVLDGLLKTAEQALVAQQSGSTSTPSAKPTAAQQRALRQLNADADAFLKTHGR